MNGEMNGTMEEPMDTNCLDSPVDQKKIESDGPESAETHSEQSNNIENSNVLDSEIKENSRNELDQDQLIEDCSTDSIKDASCASDTNILKEENSSKTVAHNKSDMDIDNKISESECNNIDTDDMEDDDDDSFEDDDQESKLPKPEDTVSINSDSESEPEDISQSDIKSKDKDVIILENDNGSEGHNGASNHSSSPEVHEILSDNEDCVIENEKPKQGSQLRRSSRTIKRKKYEEDIENGDEESDIEEVEMDDPLDYKSKPIVINNTKDLVVMAANQAKSNNNQKNETTVVIINSQGSGKSNNSNKSSTPSINTNNVQSLYQSIVARGTTVTPVSSKTNSSSSTPSLPTNTQPSILPSLTDDMFVVEAPSFIVPYVYEKPSVKPFREFVDTLGKELEEKKTKEEKDKKDKEAKEKEVKAKEKQEKRERGEEVSESEEETENVTKDDNEDEEKKRKRAEKKERRRRRNDDDDASWDGESSSDSEDETMSDDDTVVLKNKADSLEVKQVTDLTADKVCVGKSHNYFDCSLGKFFINIGLNLVQEHVQNDLLKQQNRKLYREKKAGHSTKAIESSIASLMKNLEFSKENNAPYALPQKKCDFCSFKTESSLVLDHHLETPHMKNNLYKCNFCAFENRSPRDILYHMEAEHNSKGKLERAPAYHQCANCPFEDNGKGKLARHLVACAKKFKPDHNLSPPIEWEPPAKIPKITKARNIMSNSYQSAFSRQLTNNLTRTPIAIANFMPSGGGAGYRPRGRSPLAAPPRSAPAHGAPLVRAGVMVRHNAPNATTNYPNASNGKKNMHQPSISITPLPRQPQPVPVPQQSKNTFVICEICDGYIKDLEQLRNHMQWIHKVKIHPKMIYNRPPLNCQKCQFRFFTDQGLERHLLGSHGLVTSSMQEAANKGKDAGRCPVCGRVYQWKLLNHVAKDHSLTLKPAHLSYKCTVCSATFGTYKQFESHVYSAHSVVAKRVMDKGKAPPKPVEDSLLKPLKINDEITIIPQPAKPTTSTKNK